MVNSACARQRRARLHRHSIYADGVFSPASRERLKAELIAAARNDDRAVAAALLGSSSTGSEDEWSDIDLALSIDGDCVAETIEEWTALMYDDHGAVHHFDVRWDRTLYRVFLLASTLQVDLSFWHSDDFVAAGSQFRLLFGEAPANYTLGRLATDAIIGEAWLYLLHARSAIARGRRWQANYMIAGVRDRVLQIACRRHHAREDDARGVDDLPAALLVDYAAMIPSSLRDGALRLALEGVTAGLIREARETDPDLAGRIADTLKAIVSATPTEE